VTDLPPDAARKREQSAPAHRADPPELAASGTRARHRRVTTDPPLGSDPKPAPEPPRHLATENDERLKQDKPPHWA
jgi:hypothetical protein